MLIKNIHTVAIEYQAASTSTR